MTENIYSNQNNKDFKIINKTPYDFKNAKKIWIEIITRTISKSEAKKLYNKLIQKDTDALTKEKSNDTKKYNILNILNNVGSIFIADTYLHYKDESKETMFKRSIAERIKLRK